MSNELVQLAFDLGFDAIATGRPADVPPVEDILRRHGPAGLSSFMPLAVWENKNRPAELLPGVRSIIALAKSYNWCRAATAVEGGALSEGVHKITLPRYLWTRDYHPWFARRLQQIHDYLQCAYPGSKALAMCDTGPGLDRPLAIATGLGYAASNCMLTVPELGGRVWLGELLTTADLPTVRAVRFEGTENYNPCPASTRSQPSCSNCNRCTAACPAGALAVGRLDPRMCLAQWTQSRGWLPKQVRELIRRQVFSCDTCLSCCPQNQSAPQVEIPPDLFLPSLPAQVTLEGVARMQADTFRRTFALTAGGWRGRNVWRRNAVVCLGNVGGPHTVSLLTELMQDASPIVRGHSAWALWRLAQRGLTEMRHVRTTLEQVLAGEQEERVRKEMRSVLEDL